MNSPMPNCALSKYSAAINPRSRVPLLTMASFEQIGERCCAMRVSGSTQLGLVQPEPLVQARGIAAAHARQLEERPQQPYRGGGRKTRGRFASLSSLRRPPASVSASPSVRKRSCFGNARHRVRSAPLLLKGSVAWETHPMCGIARDFTRAKPTNAAVAARRRGVLMAMDARQPGLRVAGGSRAAQPHCVRTQPHPQSQPARPQSPAPAHRAPASRRNPRRNPRSRAWNRAAPPRRPRRS